MQETTSFSESISVCRFCLASSDNLQHIFNHETIDIPAIVKILTNLELAESDPFSKLVCSKCIATVESIVEFRRSCLQSFHEAERKLVPQDEPSLHKELLQVEFIKCESPGISDYDGYEQEDTFSNQSECNPEHDGEGENSSIQASDKQCRNDNTTEQLRATTVEARKAESSENEAKDTLSTSQRSGNKSKFIPKLTGIVKAESAKTREKNKQKASSQTARPNGQIQTLRIDSSSNHNVNNRLKKPESVKPQIYACEVCGKTFKTKSNYTNHRKTHNWNEATTAPNSQTPEHQSMSEQKRIYLCNICGHNCGSSSNLSVHLRRHNGQSVCECTVCGKGFPRRSDLVMHMRKHTGEKPYVCPTCGRGFSRLDKLRIHIRTHTGEKPYRCPCGRGYAQKNDLKTHQKRNICGQNFDVEKLLAPRPTTICIKSPPRQSAQSSAAAPSHSTAPNAIPSTYSTRRDAGLNLEHEPMEDMVFPGSWANCNTTPHHFQHHERDATDGYEDGSSYTHQSKLTA
uniref:Uncharacterized protein n=2 Tax=Anopheles gambiae TaxID=7165 RepID=A0A1S4GZE8_ANOGA